MQDAVDKSNQSITLVRLLRLATSIRRAFFLANAGRNSVSVAEKPQGIIANVATDEGLPEAFHPPQARFRQRPDDVQTLCRCCQIAGVASGAVTGETYKIGINSPTHDCPPTLRDGFRVRQLYEVRAERTQLQPYCHWKALSR